MTKKETTEKVKKPATKKPATKKPIAKREPKPKQLALVHLPMNEEPAPPETPVETILEILHKAEEPEVTPEDVLTTIGIATSEPLPEAEEPKPAPEPATGFIIHNGMTYIRKDIVDKKEQKGGWLHSSDPDFPKEITPGMQFGKIDVVRLANKEETQAAGLGSYKSWFVFCNPERGGCGRQVLRREPHLKQGAKRPQSCGKCTQVAAKSEKIDLSTPEAKQAYFRSSEWDYPTIEGVNDNKPVAIWDIIYATEPMLSPLEMRKRVHLYRSRMGNNYKGRDILACAFDPPNLQVKPKSTGKVAKEKQDPLAAYLALDENLKTQVDSYILQFMDKSGGLTKTTTKALIETFCNSDTGITKDMLNARIADPSLRALVNA